MCRQVLPDADCWRTKHDTVCWGYRAEDTVGVAPVMRQVSAFREVSLELPVGQCGRISGWS